MWRAPRGAPPFLAGKNCARDGRRAHNSLRHPPTDRPTGRSLSRGFFYVSLCESPLNPPTSPMIGSPPPPLYNDLSFAELHDVPVGTGTLFVAVGRDSAEANDDDDEADLDPVLGIRIDYRNDDDDAAADDDDEENVFLSPRKKKGGERGEGLNAASASRERIASATPPSLRKAGWSSTSWPEAGEIFGKEPTFATEQYLERRVRFTPAPANRLLAGVPSSGAISCYRSNDPAAAAAAAADLYRRRRQRQRQRRRRRGRQGLRQFWPLSIITDLPSTTRVTKKSAAEGEEASASARTTTGSKPSAAEWINFVWDLPRLSQPWPPRTASSCTPLLPHARTYTEFGPRCHAPSRRAPSTNRSATVWRTPSEGFVETKYGFPPRK